MTRKALDLNMESKDATCITSKSTNEEKFRLKRKIGLFTGISLLVGTMIGSGIFLSPTGVLRYVGGSVGLSLVIWVACGVVCTLTGLCYCELGLAIPESGESNTYLLYGYGKYGRFFAFLHAWAFCLIIRPSGNAALGVAAGEYISSPFYPGCTPPDIVIKLIGGVVIILVTLSNCVSIKISARIQVVTTIGKVLVLLIIVVIGFVQMGKKNPTFRENFNGPFDLSEIVPGTIESLGASEISLALYQGLFPYNGWSNLNFITEEIRKPEVNLPRAILISLPAVTLLYLLVNIAYFTVLTPADMLTSRAVAVTFADRTITSWGWIIPVGVAISIYGALNGNFLSNGRMFYVASRREFYPEILSMVHVEFFSPSPALIVLCILSCLYMIPANFDILITAFAFTSWLFYGLTVTGLLIMRKTRKDMERPYKVPLPIPIIVILICIFFVIAPLVGEPSAVFLIVPCFLFIGVLAYFPFVHFRWSIPGMNRFTIFMQQLGNIAPTDNPDVRLGKTD